MHQKEEEKKKKRKGGGKGGGCIIQCSLPYLPFLCASERKRGKEGKGGGEKRGGEREGKQRGDLGLLSIQEKHLYLFKHVFFARPDEEKGEEKKGGGGGEGGGHGLSCGSSTYVGSCRNEKRKGRGGGRDPGKNPMVFTKHLLNCGFHYIEQGGEEKRKGKKRTSGENHARPYRNRDKGGENLSILWKYM